MCAQFRMALKTDIIKLRERIWAGLQKVIGLSSCEELEKAEKV